MAHPDSEHAPAAILARQNTMIGVIIAMTLVGALAVGLRVFTRAYIVGRMWAEDWAMLAAMTFAFGYALEVLIATKSFHIGFRGSQLSTEDMIGIIKVTIAMVVTYKMVLALTKVSLLCFYLRIAVQPTFKLLSKWTLLIVVVFQIVLIFGTIGQCVPMEKTWDLTGTVKGKCIDVNTFFHVGSIFHIVTDVWILALPAKVVFSIPRPLKERLALYAIFGLGFITVTAAIFRLQFFHAYTVSKDPFFAILPIHIWSMVEINVGILCASLPTLRPLFSAAQRHTTRAANPDKLMATEEKGLGTKGTLTTSGTIAIGIGSTIRGSWWRPPVPPKSPSYSNSPAPNPNLTNSPKLVPMRNGRLGTILDTAYFGQSSDKAPDSESKQTIGHLPPAGAKRLALVKRDANGIFRPEAIYNPS